jgi:hypothetical protein
MTVPNFARELDFESTVAFAITSTQISWLSLIFTAIRM